MTAARADVVVVGGGIAGLWTLARLRSAGYGAVLLEAGALGGGQTVCSQGILHGGTKYALTGKATAAAAAVAAMPGLWRDCLAGTGEVDLHGVRVLSDHQYLWSTATVTSRLAGFFAGHAMRGRVAHPDRTQWPALFQDPAFRGTLYRLDEPVLDVPGLLAAFAGLYGDALLRVDWPGGMVFHRGPDGDLARVVLRRDGAAIDLAARRFVFAAGAGNEALLASIGLYEPPMQRRPLHMVLVRDVPGEVYAHCLGAGSNPRLTVTTHYTAAGARVWYLGGELAEQGVGRDADAQIAAARAELRELLPWADLSAARFATLRIDRAEPRQPGGKRPDSRFLGAAAGALVAWPTKLVLAPRLAADVLDRLQADGIAPADTDLAALADWPRAAPALPPWEDASWQ